MSTTVPEREDSLCTDFFLGRGGINSPWAEWEEVVMMPPYLRLADDANLHCCAETLLHPQDMSAVSPPPPEPRPKMKSLLCDCWSWWSRWGWDVDPISGPRLQLFSPLAHTGPVPPTAVACKPDNTEARGCGWAVLGHPREQRREKRHPWWDDGKDLWWFRHRRRSITDTTVLEA